MCFHLWDNEGNELPWPQGYPVPGHRFHLILITHDESTFFQNDDRKAIWQHASKKGAPKPKGKGQSIMVSDFLTMEWGHLCDDTECAISFILFLIFTNLLPEKHAFSSKLESNVMVGLALMNYLLKSTTLSTSLRARQMATCKAFFYLTMPPATTSMHQMHSLPTGCLKVCPCVPLIDVQLTILP